MPQRLGAQNLPHANNLRKEHSTGEAKLLKTSHLAAKTHRRDLVQIDRDNACRFKKILDLKFIFLYDPIKVFIYSGHYEFQRGGGATDE